MESVPRDAKRIFFEAVEIEAGAERAAYLDRACADDVDLRTPVEASLKAHDEADGFLESPAVGALDSRDYRLELDFWPFAIRMAAAPAGNRRPCSYRCILAGARQLISRVDYFSQGDNHEWDNVN